VPVPQAWLVPLDGQLERVVLALLQQAPELPLAQPAWQPSVP